MKGPVYFCLEEAVTTELTQLRWKLLLDKEATASVSSVASSTFKRTSQGYFCSQYMQW